VKQKLAYGAAGFVVWGVVAFVIMRYVLNIHSMPKVMFGIGFSAVLGAYSAYHGERLE
jgi:hypothetical protein